MMPSRRTLPRSALPLCMLLCLSAAAHAADSVDPDWLPLRAGAQWIYELHRDQTYQPDNASSKRIFHVGRATGTAEPAPKRAGAVLVRERSELQPVEGSVVPEVLAQWNVYSFGSELLVHASGETREDGSESESVYEPPLRLLPTTKVGATWSAGTFRTGDQTMEMRGEVLGLEDVPGTPGWSQCLKVRYRGNVVGSATAEKDRAEIESARFERVVWYARGVGIVRDVTTTESDLKLPDGHTTHSSQILTQRLLEFRPSK
jgi:hypothetical protein